MNIVDPSTIDVVLWAIFGGCGYYAVRRFWRQRAVATASQWTSEHGLRVRTWSNENFNMHRQNPTIEFIATGDSEETVEVKLRLKFEFAGGMSVDEVAYCPARKSEAP